MTNDDATNELWDSLELEGRMAANKQRINYHNDEFPFIPSSADAILFLCRAEVSHSTNTFFLAHLHSHPPSQSSSTFSHVHAHSDICRFSNIRQAVDVWVENSLTLSPGEKVK